MKNSLLLAIFALTTFGAFTANAYRHSSADNSSSMWHTDKKHSAATPAGNARVNSANRSTRSMNTQQVGQASSVTGTYNGTISPDAAVQPPVVDRQAPTL